MTVYDERSQGRPTLICWRRIDVVGLELLALSAVADRVWAESTVICGEDGGFRLDHAWELTSDWRALSLRVERLDADGHRTLTLERDGGGWRVDGQRRPDLDGADDPDLSVTPFCNTFVIRRIGASENAGLTVDIAYVNGKDLTVRGHASGTTIGARVASAISISGFSRGSRRTCKSMIMESFSGTSTSSSVYRPAGDAPTLSVTIAEFC
jgi:uncharacterized protein